MTPAEALFFEGVDLLHAKDIAAAVRAFREALVLAPDFAEAQANLAWLREIEGAPGEAEVLYRSALTLNPTNLQVVLNLATLLLRAKRFDEAETLNRQALLLDPESAPAWSSLGVLLACLQREAEAEQCYRRALALDASFDRARYNLSYLLLRQGRMEEGWACREARDHFKHLSDYFVCARWQGEPLTGKSIVLGFEAGHGDMIQFARYAAVLKSMGAQQVAIVCHPDLVRLFATLAGIDLVYSYNDDVPAADWDFWSPIMSLPLYCGARLADIPAVIPYLAAEPALVNQWQALLPKGDLKIGVAWRGNPLFENDADRSLPCVDVLAPLAKVAGIHLVSLQKDSNETPANFKFLNPGAAIDDFADTAALLKCLDLVISVDTAVAHLAGSLGVPCWLLLPDYRADWRWLTGRSDTPWYPQMTLFRQPAGANWEPVIAEVAAKLALSNMQPRHAQ